MVDPEKLKSTLFGLGHVIGRISAAYEAGAQIDPDDLDEFSEALERVRAIVDEMVVESRG